MQPGAVAQQGANDANIVELLRIGPIGGVDETTSPLFVAPVNLSDGLNFIPNTQYGAFTTVLGRINALADNLGGTVISIFDLEVTGKADVYLFAIVTGGQTQIWSSTLGGVPTKLTTPTTLNPASNAFFCSLGQWAFYSDGVNTPLKIDTSLNVTNWGIQPPTTAPTLGQTTGGSLTLLSTYNYCVTFGNANQESSQGTIASITLSGSNNQVQLTNIPVSSDAQVTQRNIYRLGGALGQWRLIHTINDNVTTTYNDTAADTSLTGQSLTIFRDPPPPFAYITVHQNRIFGFNNAASTIGSTNVPANTGAVWFSNYNEPWGFNANTGILYCNSTGLDDPGIAMASLGGVLLLLKKRTAFVLYGNTDLTFQTIYAFNRGIVNPRALCTDGGTAWWRAKQGIYFYNGGTFDLVANNISAGKFQVSNIKSVLDDLTTNDNVQMCAAMYDSMPLFSIPTIGKTYGYDLRSQQWFVLSMTATCFWYDPSNQQEVIGANFETPGEIDEWFADGQDLMTNIMCTITSRKAYGERIEAIKKAKFCVISAPELQDVRAEVVLILNPGDNQVELEPLSYDLSVGGPQHVQDFPNNEFNSVAVRITVTVSQQTVIEQISIFGAFERGLPATMLDGP